MSKRIAYGSNLIGVDSGGSSGGHTIWNAIKTALTQRTKLWFADAKVSDDSTDGATKVQVLQDGMSASDFDSASNLQDGVYPVYDESPVRLTDTMIQNTVSGRGNTVADAIADTVSKANGGTFGGNVIVDRKDGTASAEGFSYLKVGNATPAGTNQNSTGLIELYSESEYSARLYANPLTQQRYIGLPDKNGTVALTSDTVKVQTLAVSQEVGSISIPLTVENTNILNGIFFSRSWSDQSNPLKGSLYWISIRPSNNSVGFYALKEETVETGVRTAIDSATYDSTTQLLTITFKDSVQRFCEFIYY